MARYHYGSVHKTVTQNEHCRGGLAKNGNPALGATISTTTLMVGTFAETTVTSLLFFSGAGACSDGPAAGAKTHDAHYRND